MNPASTACLVFINAIATEGWDRDGLHDPRSDSLITHVASQCANTIVIIHSAGIRLVDPWITHPNITAVILAHLPGQDSGMALEQLIYGEENFSGKLPYTIAKNESDYTPYEPCTARSTSSRADPQCDYTEGVYLDYRAFDRDLITPRFEFGYGLSYTTFTYTGLHMETLNLTTHTSTSLQQLFTPTLLVSAHITNSGSVAGAEIAQLYVSIPNSPPKQLRGFSKVTLQPGSTALAEFTLTRRDLSVWDVVTQTWTIQDGDYEIMVGGSSSLDRLVLRGSMQVGAEGKQRQPSKTKEQEEEDEKEEEAGGWREVGGGELR